MQMIVGFKKVSDQVNFKNMMELSLLGFVYVAEKILLTLLSDEALQLYSNEKANFIH